MSNPALFSLQQVLKKCFQSLETNLKIWNSVLAECTSLVTSLGNAAEQLRALSNVEISNTPLCTFPHLQERLQFKLTQAVDLIFGKLNEKMSALQSVKHSVSQQMWGAIHLYEQHSDSLDLATCTQRSATTPSISEMLEWLQDAERYFQRQFLRGRSLLQSMRPNDLSLLESLPKRWEALYSTTEEESISDMLFKVSFFIESQ